jgi:thiamine-phosphate pyrophosphorylase
MADNLTTTLRLVLVTDDALLAGRDLITLAGIAVAGGVTAVELRLKQTSPRVLVETARRLKRALRVPVLVNDRPDVAAAAGLGVHLGPDDLSPLLAREVLGAAGVIGASVASEAEAERGAAADYWGIGAWRTTGTKDDAGPALGAARFAAIARLAGERPRLAIGGVRPEDVPDIIAAGGTGVAIASGILGAADVEAAARSYASALERVI